MCLYIIYVSTYNIYRHICVYNLCVYIEYTLTHMYIYAYMYIFICVYIPIYMRIYVYITRLKICNHTNCTSARALNEPRAHTLTHTYTYTHAHTHPYTYTRTLAAILSMDSSYDWLSWKKNQIVACLENSHLITRKLQRMSMYMYI